jgi:hypothetical protein
MIAYTTRNRPQVLEYSLSKLREHYDGFCVVIDDCSDTKESERIAKRFDCAYLYNDKRRGIPRSKERGFRSLLSFYYQYWFDDDCYPKPGWLDRIQEAQEYHGHLLHIKQWAHIRRIGDVQPGMVEYSGGTACFMSFTREQYEYVHGFQSGHGVYGGWHGALSQKLEGGYIALKDSSDYFHSFDIDGIPSDFNGGFASSLSYEERRKK